MCEETDRIACQGAGNVKRGGKKIEQTKSNLRQYGRMMWSVLMQFCARIEEERSTGDVSKNNTQDILVHIWYDLEAEDKHGKRGDKPKLVWTYGKM